MILRTKGPERLPPGYEMVLYIPISDSDKVGVFYLQSEWLLVFLSPESPVTALTWGLPQTFAGRSVIHPGRERLFPVPGRRLSLPCLEVLPGTEPGPFCTPSRNGPPQPALPEEEPASPSGLVLPFPEVPSLAGLPAAHVALAPLPAADLP